MHLVLKKPTIPPFPDFLDEVFFGMGCFWGVEKLFWDIKGVWSTAVGYAGGSKSNPTYEDVCSGESGHAEVVRVVFDSKIVTIDSLLKTFWKSHDPTQGMRQGNDIGSQYRSIIMLTKKQHFDIAETSQLRVNDILRKNNFNETTTQIQFFEEFYYAEDYHQQYLEKNPNGYCNRQGHQLSLEY